MKAKEYNLIEKCIQDGVRMGFARAHKYTDNPTKEQMIQDIEKYVLDEICEWFVLENWEEL